MLDTILLKLMKDRKTFYQLYESLPKDNASVGAQTNAILTNFKKYYDAFPNHLAIDKDTFIPRFQQWNPGLKQEQLAHWNAVLFNIFADDADADQRAHIVSWVAEVELATRIANLAETYNQGEFEGDILSAVLGITDDFKRRSDIKFDTWIDESIDSLLLEDLNQEGLRWRLACVNASMRPLRAGDFGIIAGRPDQGKTTLISSECTYWAPQLPADQNVLWLNNEGPGRRIVPRLYQSALGISITELGELSRQGRAEEEYIKIVGRRDRIRVVDIHSKTIGQVEMIIEENNAGVVIYDMIDNIAGFGDAARTDLQLEKMYQRGREIAVKYEAVGIATSQISNDGDGLLYPTMNMLKDSKTGKQGACDFQLMIGSSHDPNLKGIRGIGIPKNKLRKPDGPADPHTEVSFDGRNARYTDLDGEYSLPDPSNHRDTASSAIPQTQATAAELDSLLSGA